MAEHVLIAPRLEVQNRADPQQEVLGLIESGAVGGQSLEQRGVRRPRERAQRREIAEPARRVLDVGLQLIRRVVERRVALVDQLLERRDHEGARLGGVEERRDLFEEGRRSDQRPCVGQREEERGIGGVELRQFLAFADLMTDVEPHVPERMQERAQKLLAGQADGPAEQDQHVDIRVETQVPSSVAAEREDGDVRRRVRRGFEELPDQPVDTVREVLERNAPGRAACGLR